MSSPVWLGDSKTIVYVDGNTSEVKKFTLGKSVSTVVQKKIKNHRINGLHISADRKKLYIRGDVSYGTLNDYWVKDMQTGLLTQYDNPIKQYSSEVVIEDEDHTIYHDVIYKTGSNVPDVNADGFRHGDVVSIDADGNEIKIFDKNDLGRVFLIDVSLDGTKLLVNVNDATPERPAGIYAVDSTGTDLHLISLDNNSGAISPDGQTIVYGKSVYGENQLWACDWDGSNKRILSSDFYDYMGTWSPDGTKIAFIRNDPDAQKSYIMIAALDGDAPSSTVTPTGFTINGKAKFTNSTNVVLSLYPPEEATTVEVSNDGSFLDAQEFELTDAVMWQLDDIGASRLPRIVYVRYGTGITYTDDIVLDTADPVLSSVAVSKTSASAVVAFAATKKRKLTITARDALSGLAAVQIATNSAKTKLKAVKYSKTVVVSVPTATKKIWVRVKDRAGNWSTWKAKTV